MGTISSGVWQGTAIASAYLDADTAHLSGTQTFTGDKTFSSGSLTVSSSTTAEPILHITNTHSGATSGELRFNKDSSSGADSDVMGVISFYGTDASNNTHEKLAYMDAIITDSAEGSEASSLRFFVAENDANLTIGLKIDGQPDNDGEVDVTIGAGTSSTTTIAGTLTMGSTAALTNTGLVAVANQSNITGLGSISSGTWEATDIEVSHGGTGASSLTANGILIGNGTSAITAVDMSTKGHIIVGDGTGNPRALVLGTNDQVLTVDSTTATGVKWAAASGGGGGGGKYALYSTITISDGGSTTSSNNAFTIPANSTIISIMCIVNTTFTYDNASGGAIAIDIYKGSISSNNSIFKTSVGFTEKMIGLSEFNGIQSTTVKGTIKEFISSSVFESSDIITGSSSQNYGVKITSNESSSFDDPGTIDGDGVLRVYVEYLNFA